MRAVAVVVLGSCASRVCGAPLYPASWPQGDVPAVQGLSDVLNRHIEDVRNNNQDKPWVSVSSGKVQKGLYDIFVVGRTPCAVYTLAALHLRKESEPADTPAVASAKEKLKGFEQDLLNATSEELNFVVLALTRDLLVAGVED